MVAQQRIVRTILLPDTSPVSGMPYRLTNRDAVDFLKDKGYRHHHTSGDHVELKHDNGTLASVFGAGK